MNKITSKVRGDFTTVPPDATAEGVATGNSEFCRMGDLKRLFGIVRTHAYLLEKHGLIKTVSLRRPGNARGVKLVYVASVRNYLHGLMANKGGK